jgi:hypothetical protein
MALLGRRVKAKRHQAPHILTISQSQLCRRHHDSSFGIRGPDRRHQLGGTGSGAEDPPHVQRLGHVGGRTCAGFGRQQGAPCRAIAEAPVSVRLLPLCPCNGAARCRDNTVLVPLRWRAAGAAWHGAPGLCRPAGRSGDRAIRPKITNEMTRTNSVCTASPSIRSRGTAAAAAAVARCRQATKPSRRGPLAARPCGSLAAGPAGVGALRQRRAARVSSRP